MIVRAEGPSGPAKVNSDDPKHALGLVHYLRTIDYEAWIEDANGNEIEESVLKNAIKVDVLPPIATRRAAAPSASSASVASYRSHGARWAACSSRMVVGDLAGLPALMNAPCAL
jgi:hypothetical protein